MAKPPKKFATPPITDISATTTTTTTTSTTTRTVETTSSRAITATVDAFVSRPGSTVAHVTQTTQGPETRQAAVVVTPMPDRAVTSPDAANRAIAWPQSRRDELTPFGENTGLFTGPDQRIYAQIADEGLFVVERNQQGRYYVPLTFAPGVPGPLLAKIDGQASWRIQRPGWQTSPEQGETSAAAQTPTYISIEDAKRLTAAEMDTNGVRYNKLKQTFVTTVDGTVMVRKNQNGEYQQAFASTSEAPEIFFEQIYGTVFWRRKTLHTASTETANAGHPASAEPTEAIAGPSKRARVEEPTQASSGTQDEEAKLAWIRWGLLNTPPVASVQMGHLHYPIVPVGSNKAPQIFFVLNPEFMPTDFNSFENMLQTAPHLQPVAAYRFGVNPGEVHPGDLLFQQPLWATVRQMFPGLSDLTARAVAIRMYETADNSSTITGTGLVNIHTILNQWKYPAFANATEFADPVSMLAVAPYTERAGKRLIRLPSQTDAELLRLTFDPQGSPVEWHHYTTDPTELNLQRLLSALLRRSGYDIYPVPHERGAPTLVFKGAQNDRVFLLKGAVDHSDLSPTPADELTQPGLPARVGPEAFEALTEAAAQKKLTWLLGGVLKVDGVPDSVFIVRER